MYARDVKSKLYGDNPLNLEKGTGDYYDVMVREHFGNKLREYRAQLRLTREEFAADFNKEMNPEKPMKKHNVISWETAEAFPLPRTLISLYVYLTTKKGIHCDFNDFMMFDGLEGDTNTAGSMKLKLQDNNTDANYRLLTIPYSLLEHFDGKTIMLEIKDVLFPATVDLNHRRLLVTEDGSDYDIAFSKAARLKLYHIMDNTEEHAQSSSVLSLTEAKRRNNVYIYWMDQSDPEFAKNMSGYYSYVPTLKAFTNARMDIHLNENDYLKTYFATQDYK